MKLSEAHTDRAIRLDQEHGDVVGAIAAFREALRFAPDSIRDPWNNLATALSDERSPAHDQKPELVVMLHEVAKRIGVGGKPTPAERAVALGEAVLPDTKRSDAHMRRAMRLQNLKHGDIVGAIAEFRQALRFAQDSAVPPWNSLALVLDDERSPSRGRDRELVEMLRSVVRRMKAGGEPTQADRTAALGGVGVLRAQRLAKLVFRGEAGSLGAAVALWAGSSKEEGGVNMAELLKQRSRSSHSVHATLLDLTLSQESKPPRESNPTIRRQCLLWIRMFTEKEEYTFSPFRKACSSTSETSSKFYVLRCTQ